MEIAIIMCIANIVCFITGAKIGQFAAQNKEIKLPNPINALEEYREKLEERKEREREDIMLENINNYDGTGMGQQDV